MEYDSKAASVGLHIAIFHECVGNSGIRVTWKWTVPRTPRRKTKNIAAPIKRVINDNFSISYSIQCTAESFHFETRPRKTLIISGVSIVTCPERARAWWRRGRANSRLCVQTLLSFSYRYIFLAQKLRRRKLSVDIQEQDGRITTTIESDTSRRVRLFYPDPISGIL